MKRDKKKNNKILRSTSRQNIAIVHVGAPMNDRPTTNPKCGGKKNFVPHGAIPREIAEHSRFCKNRGNRRFRVVNPNENSR